MVGCEIAPSGAATLSCARIFRRVPGVPGQLSKVYGAVLINIGDFLPS
jgi:hypothetical protein